MKGALVPDGNTYRFEYFMKDHLGNTRATYAAACPGVPQVAEYNHYTFWDGVAGTLLYLWSRFAEQ